MSKNDLNKDAHSTFIHNSQKCNTPHISTNMKINCRHPSKEGYKRLVCARNVMLNPQRHIMKGKAEQESALYESKFRQKDPG